jgi:hypothetical protein
MGAKFLLKNSVPMTPTFRRQPQLDMTVTFLIPFQV